MGSALEEWSNSPRTTRWEDLDGRETWQVIGKQLGVVTMVFRLNLILSIHGEHFTRPAEKGHFYTVL